MKEKRIVVKNINDKMQQNSIMKRSILLLTILSIIILTVSVNAKTTESFEDVQLGQCLDIIQTCSGSTYSNISQITRDGRTLITNELVMTKRGYTYNYTYCPSTAGYYIVDMHCDEYAIDTAAPVDFWVKTNKGTDEKDNTIFAIATIVALLVIWGCHRYVSKVLGSFMLFVMGIGLLKRIPEEGWLGWMVIAVGFIAILYSLMGGESSRKKRYK